MLTRWLTFTAFLAVSADLVSAAFSSSDTMTVAPTCRVKGCLEEDLTLSCGDQFKAGIIQYWHTPFGDLESPSFQNTLDPVFMHDDGSLVVSNMSSLHSGLYYCLLLHKQGSTLWSYELNVGHKHETDDEDSNQHHCGALRIRRDVGLAEERQRGVSDEECAGAVAASVLLTFVLAFSAGALSRSRVLRCLGTITTRLKSPKRKRQSDTVDHGTRVSVSTLPPMSDHQAFEMEPVTLEEDSASFGQMDFTFSSTASSPPAKPKRSFGQSREEKQEATTYLEGCDYKNTEEGKEDEEEQQRSQKENSEGCDEEAEKEKESSSTFYISDKDGSQTETEEDECSADQEQRDGTESREEEKREGSELENSGSSSGEEEEGRVTEDEERDTEKQDKGRREGDEGSREERGDDGANKQEEDADDEKHEGTEENGASSSPTPHGRRSRVIRLYQYDEDGQRYSHLPDPTPNELGPSPTYKHRSLSLTRLSTIMAVATAGPLDSMETGKKEEERPHFHMKI